MSSFCVSLLILALCQDPVVPAADPQVKAISPFVGSDVFAVLQIDLARLNATGSRDPRFRQSAAGNDGGCQNGHAQIERRSPSGRSQRARRRLQL